MPSNVRDFLEAVARHAATEPERTAFRLADDAQVVELSYEGLQDRVRRLGSALRATGLGEGTRVALSMENRPAWPVAYLSIWYAGGVVVPIDPALDPSSMEKILRHSGTRACLTSMELMEKMLAATSPLSEHPAIYTADSSSGRFWDGEPSQGELPVIPVKTTSGIGWDELIATHPTDSDESWSPAPMTDALATIVYTSGTTGIPKGVMLTRAGLLANIEAGLARIRIDSNDHLLGVLPLFHVLPLMTNCLGPLYVGARVTFLTQLNPERIIAAFPQHEITAFACVPLFFYRFHDRVMHQVEGLPRFRRGLVRCLLGVASFARRRLGLNLGRRLFRMVHAPFGHNLRLLVTGGAKFDTTVYQDFLNLGFRLVQGYGLTEATAVITASPLDDLRSDTVGVPVDGVEVDIRQPNEEGIGEVIARGPSTMLGYYRNQEATDEVLRDGWLRTGDLGRLLPGGHLQVTGRAKDMIVLASGKNIYPDELEHYYSKSKFISEICILGITDPSRRDAERLHAIVVPDVDAARAGGYVNIREMVKWELETLAARLPRAQRLTSIEVRNQPLPRTTTRKLKRFVLKAEFETKPYCGHAESHSSPLVKEPTSDEALAPLSREVLTLIAQKAKRGAVHLNDHLDLDLGLDSIDRVELLSHLEDAYELEIGEDSIGGLQTVSDLLDMLSNRISRESHRPAIPQGDQWGSVLQRCPADVEAYLERRPTRELFFWLLSRTLHLAIRCIVGFRSSGQDNLPQQYPFIISPNHFSYVDAFVLALALPLRVHRRIFFLGYTEHFQGLLGRFIARLFRTIPIDQNRNLETAMQAAAEGLRRGMVLGIFPEGGRSIDGTVKEFRRGTVILSRHLEAPIVPTGLWGTYEMWPREGTLRLHRTSVAFGAPLEDALSTTPVSEAKLTATLRGRVIDLVDEAAALYRRSGKANNEL